MDEEKNNIDVPEIDQSDVDSGNEAAQNESPPAENAGDGAIDEQLGGGDEEAESVGDSNGPEDLLSQDQIDNVLGDIGERNMDDVGGSKGGLPDMGNLSVDETEVKQADFQQLSSSHDGSEPRNINLLLDVELPVSIELGRTRMRISDILGLGPGSIVELDKLVGEPVDLLVNKKCVARGEVVVVEESFGLRITMLVSPEERLKNLA